MDPVDWFTRFLPVLSGFRFSTIMVVKDHQLLKRSLPKLTSNTYGGFLFSDMERWISSPDPLWSLSYAFCYRNGVLALDTLFCLRIMLQNLFFFDFRETSISLWVLTHAAVLQEIDENWIGISFICSREPTEPRKIQESWNFSRCFYRTRNIFRCVPMEVFLWKGQENG